MTEETQKGRYLVSIDVEYSWAEYCWVYKIVDTQQKNALGIHPVVWKDSTATKMGARFAAKRALKKIRKGRPQVKPTLEEYYTD